MAHIIIEGKVQGVGYRASTRRIASQLGLHGWVRNLRDGRVEIIVEGEEEMIDRLVQWCSRGPTSAFVGKVTIEKTEPTGKYNGFQIRGTL